MDKFLNKLIEDGKVKVIKEDIEEFENLLNDLGTKFWVFNFGEDFMVELQIEEE